MSDSAVDIEAALRASQVEYHERAERDRRVLRNDLAEVVITALHYFDKCDEARRAWHDAELPTEHDHDIAVGRYQNEAVFHAKVETVVTRMIDVLRKNGVNV